MNAVIAKSDLGPCAGCGVRIEKGDHAVQRAAGTTHPNCEPRIEAQPADTPAPSGFLFAMSDQPAREREASRTVELSRPHVGALVDGSRYMGQLARVYELMSDQQFRTLETIAELTGMLETSASARLRDFRKDQHGSHDVVSRVATDGSGVREYRLIVNRGETNERRSAA